jgi:hypothetical protein
MTHDQLARVFPDGKTVHIPTDGRPLSNYHAALAEVDRRGGRSSGAAVSPVRTASAADQGSSGKRSIFAKLLGIGSDEEEDSAPVSAQPAPAPGPRVATAPAPRVIAAAAPTRTAAVPLPRSRPQQPQQEAQANPYQLASATSRPYQPAPVQGSASDAVQSRYEWREGPQAAAAPAGAVGSPNQVPSSGAIGDQDQRFSWLTGPDGRPAVRPQRPVGPVVAASADPAWLPTEGTDRVAPDVALSYAANSGGSEPETRSTTKQAMGSIRQVPPRAAAVPPPAPSRQPASTVKVGQRFDDPWLRGLVIAPSMAYSMQVVKFGPQDYRNLRSLMEKPRQSIALVFSYDPHLGITPGRFTGPAVAFLPTISFGSRTAGLN